MNPNPNLTVESLGICMSLAQLCGRNTSQIEIWTLGGFTISWYCLHIREMRRLMIDSVPHKRDSR
jgi:hypothetical protein